MYRWRARGCFQSPLALVDKLRQDNISQYFANICAGILQIFSKYVAKVFVNSFANILQIYYDNKLRWNLLIPDFTGGDGAWRLPDPKRDEGGERRHGDLQRRRPLRRARQVHSGEVVARQPSLQHCWPVCFSPFWTRTKVLLGNLLLTFWKLVQNQEGVLSCSWLILTFVVPSQTTRHFFRSGLVGA